MKDYKPEEIKVDGQTVKTLYINEVLVAISDLFHGAEHENTPAQLYSKLTKNSNFKKIKTTSLAGTHWTWFTNFNGIKFLQAMLLSKYGICDYTKRFDKFSEKAFKAARLGKKEGPVPAKSEPKNEPLHLIAKVENDRPLASARRLYKGLGLSKNTRFSQWVKQNFDGFEEGYDFTSVFINTDMPNGGTKQIKDYLLTLDMAKELCMLSRTEKGKQVRHYFIQVEKKYRQQKSLPQTPEEKLALTMKVTNRLVPRVSHLEKDVDQLKNEAEIDSDQRYQLWEARKKKAIQVCGGKKSNFYQQKKGRKVFQELGRDFKEQFVVTRYDHLKKKDFPKAMKFIKDWYPSYPLKEEIDAINSQTSFDM